MRKKYVKGDKEKIITRINQVSEITLYVPSSERCIDYLHDGLLQFCSYYYFDNSFLLIPTIDFYNVSLFVNKCCKENNVDVKYIIAIIDIIKTFEKLKHISVIFSDDDIIKKSYEKIVNINQSYTAKDAIDELKNIYSIDLIEMYFSDMFDQSIIDMINKHLISNEIISNSYLDRDFFIDFDFEEYVSYINMFINNNKDKLNMYDSDIIDYLSVFPTIIGDFSNPIIKVYTNYSEV